MKFDEKTRGYIYRVLIAAGVIVAAYGLMTADQVAQWVGLAAVVLNIMPTANTTVKAPKNEDVVL